MDVDGGAGEVEKVNPQEGEPKVKRKMKTPSQLEILEKTYAVETYPSEALRAELSVKLGITDRQLQMWFCHRRSKDRKIPIAKRRKKGVSPSAVAGPSGGSADELVVGNADVGEEHGLGLSLFENVDLLHQQRTAHKVGTAVPRISKELPSMRRLYEPPLAVSEQRAIAFVEVQLGESLREDGPILGMEFDPIPPGAFGAPIVTSVHQKPPGWFYDPQIHERLNANLDKGISRALHEYQFLPEKPSFRKDADERDVPSHHYGCPADIQKTVALLPTGRSVMHSKEQVSSEYNLQGQMPSVSFLHREKQGYHLSPAPGEVDIAPILPPLVNVNIDAHYLVHPINGLDSRIITPETHIIHEEERLQRKHKTEEVHEKRIRKELEKQDFLRRKREEQMRKEMERQNRERRKEEEKVLREKHREEERYQREQRREIERRKKFLQKENLRAENMRRKEETRRAKEASRLKTANNRVAARRIAKESIELVEDQRLELMELAAFSRGLPSVLALDSETLENLDLFKDKLPEFPPKSVHMKRPFEVQPWTDSEESVCNLLMVWRFLITFADVLSLWPFTLDEFCQAIHNGDSRLLEEIHIALLRSIMKDIEDVATTPATAMVANLNSVVTPGGGHPQIVEGAYAWGFDLHSWLNHLTPLTWLEILRQFALSAGFGPKLKKWNVETAYIRDENEDDGGAGIMSNLRSGLAAENAVAIMREKGFSNPRRCKHRLTPGTVKYAVFHVLSVEGSKGLPILDVADKIQKSGLRDLTTSKTPEASISAALSRDTKLFERTAPSTYCVRSPYRKDPADAEVILTEAREKIWVNQSGYLNGVEPEGVEKENINRDQDYASDVADNPDADGPDEVLKLKIGCHSSTKRRFEDKCLPESTTKKFLSELNETPSDGHGGCSTSVDETKVNGGSGDLSVIVTRINSLTVIPGQEDNLVDECSSGEAWVQGLTEGEYTDLSIEERLDALVALIGVANEGNTIRTALEERLQAANALKKQMWAEVKLEKRRIKEHISKLQQSSPLVGLNDQQTGQTYSDSIISEKNHFVPELSLGSESISLQQSLQAMAEKPKSDLKAFIGHWAKDMYVYRSLPLGQDRRHNRYWQFITSSSQNDPGSRRIFVELCTNIWRVIDSEEGFDALLSSLDVRGLRESHLHLMLRKIESSFKGTSGRNFSTNSGNHLYDDVQKEVREPKTKLDCYSSMGSPKSLEPVSTSKPPKSSTPFVVELESRVKEENGIVWRFKDYEKWMLDECFNLDTLFALKYGRLRCQRLLEICSDCHALFYFEDSHCPSCHKTFSSSDRTPEHATRCDGKPSEGFDRVFVNSCHPPRIRLLKAQLATIESSIPPEAFEYVWSCENRKPWAVKLCMASKAEEILQALTLLENSIRRDFLSANYETTRDILSSCKIVGSATDSSSRPEDVSLLPWIPLTTPAMGLRLMELDASIYYSPQRKEACEKDNGDSCFSKLRSRYPVQGSSIDNVPSHARNLKKYSYGFDISSKRVRGRPIGSNRSRGGKTQRAKSRKSCFSVISRKRSTKRARGDKGVEVREVAEDILFDDSPGIIHEKWNSEQMTVEVEGNENSSNSEFEEDNNQASEDESDVHITGTIRDDDEHNEDENDVDYDINDDDNAKDEQGDYYIDENIYSDYEEERYRSGSLGRDGGLVSSSSDYSS